MMSQGSVLAWLRTSLAPSHAAGAASTTSTRHLPQQHMGLSLSKYLNLGALLPRLPRSGRDERTFMKMIVHVPTNRVVGCHMVSWLAAGWQWHIAALALIS